MAYFDELKNVDNYIKMVEGYDGRYLVEILKHHLPVKSSVLELGMGPGKDLELLARDYTVTGSDVSPLFLDKFQKDHPEADLLHLDAVDMATERKFDCIYSNKVLHHLTKTDLKLSFARQKNVLNQNGLLFHSFWYGDKEEFIDDLRFVYYQEDAIIKIAGSDFEVLEMKIYKEMEENDSFYLFLRKKSPPGE